MAAPSTGISLKLRPPAALNKRSLGKDEDFREYLKEVSLPCCAAAEMLKQLAHQVPAELTAGWCAHTRQTIPDPVQSLTKRR